MLAVVFMPTVSFSGGQDQSLTQNFLRQTGDSGGLRAPVQYHGDDHTMLLMPEDNG